MRKPVNIYNILLLSIFVVLSCAPRQSIDDETVGDEYIDKTEKRGFNPLELSLDRKIIPREHPQTGNIVGQIIIGDTSFTGDDSVYQNIENLPDEVDSLNSQAFRIQLFSSKVYGEAKYALKIAEEIFDRPLYMDYEVPYFKIRVGNFPNRDRAEEFQMRCKSSGYTNAWVVAVNIDIKETAPLYDELILPEIIDSLYYYEQYLEDELQDDENSDDDQ